MKYVAVFMVVLVLLAGAVGVYAYLNVKLEVASIEMAAYPATQQAADFQGWQNAVDNGAVSGTAFTGSIPGTADDYSYFVYQVQEAQKAGQTISEAIRTAADICIAEGKMKDFLRELGL